jgi:N utilization substance protein A
MKTSKTMDIAVAEEQLSQAIGRGGQNVRLASELTGWNLNVMIKDDADDKNTKEEEVTAIKFQR